MEKVLHNTNLGRTFGNVTLTALYCLPSVIGSDLFSLNTFQPGNPTETRFAINVKMHTNPRQYPVFPSRNHCVKAYNLKLEKGMNMIIMGLLADQLQ